MLRLPQIGTAFALSLVAFMTVQVARSEPLSPEKIPVSEDYVLRKWELEDGLPNNHVGVLAQTPDGYLWALVGLGRLARFDGVRFVPVLKENSPGLETDCVNGTYVARDGALWIGLERGGVARLYGGRFETIVSMRPNLERTYAPSFFSEDAEGAVWIVSNSTQNCFQWKQGVLTSVPIPRGSEARIFSDSAGKIWLQTRTNYEIFNGKQFQPLDPSFKGSFRLAPAKEGGMWVLREELPEQKQLLYLCQADGSKNLIADLGELGGLGVTMVNTLFTDHSGALWIGTSANGLFKLQNGRLARVQTGQSCILELMEDREGNLWVSTEGGLDRLSRRGFFVHQIRDGLSHDSVISLTQDNQGSIWLVCRDGLPSRALDSSNQSFARPPGWRGTAIMALCPNPTGGMWFGTLGGVGLWKDDSYFPGPLRDKFTALLIDRNHGLWMASIDRGLIHSKDGTYETIPTGNGLILPRALAEDDSGAIWVGTEEGLIFKETSAGGPFNQVPLAEPQPQGQIRFIVPDKADGSVWIGAFGTGLFRWKAGQVSRLTQEEGLPLSDVRSMLIDPGGDFWIGTAQGLHRVDRKQLVAAMEGRSSPVRFISYGRNDGLPGLEFSYGFRNATTRTPDGHLWFATYSGALEIKPEHLRDLVAPLPVVFESVHFRGAFHPVPPKGSLLHLPPQPGPVQIQYTSPRLSSPEQVRFRYRLIGSSEDWIGVAGQRSAVLEHLAPGNYRFEVSATDSNGEWQEPSSLQFSVKPAWWETLTFRILLGVLGAAALTATVLFILRRRMRARMRRLEQENALERERSRIARDMHDELGASLTRIALMSELASEDTPPETGSQLGAISDAVRAVVKTLDEIVWTINPRNDTLDRLIGYLSESARSFLSLTPVKFELHLPAEIPQLPVASETRHHILLAVKEALNNVVKYSKATTVRLNVAIQGGMLKIEISDDGKGFEPDMILDSSNGLCNSRHRMETMGGVYSLESQLGKGTMVVLEIPLSNLEGIPT